MISVSLFGSAKFSSLNLCLSCPSDYRRQGLSIPQPPRNIFFILTSFNILQDTLLLVLQRGSPQVLGEVLALFEVSSKYPGLGMFKQIRIRRSLEPLEHSIIVEDWYNSLGIT